MKKTVICIVRSMLAVISVVFLFGSAAFAEETETDSAVVAEEAAAETAGEENAGASLKECVFEKTGMTLYLPEDFYETAGMLSVSESGEISYGSSVYELDFVYVAMPKEKYAELTTQADVTEEEIEDYRKRYNTAATVFVCGAGRDFSAVQGLAESNGGYLDSALAEEIGKAGEYTFYYYDAPTDEYEEGLETEYREEFRNRRETLREAFKSGVYGVPANPYADLIGKTVSFETTDIDGNPVKSEELFAKHPVTMVNMWTTWCGYCIAEMEELEAIHERIGDIGCAVVGLLGDGDTPETAELGKSIMEEHGVQFQVLLPFEGMTECFPNQAWPTSFFVDSEGRILAAPIVGAQPDLYEDTIRSLAEGKTSLTGGEGQEGSTESDDEAAAGADEKAAGANPGDVYRVIVNDEDGNSVENAAVQFCSDETCTMAKTDADGIAVFDSPEGSYTVHVLKVPEGYAEDETEYPVPAVFGDVTITLKKE